MAVKMAAFRVERRSVAAAIFHGTHLEHTDMKQLPSEGEKAEAGTVGFVNGILSDFDVSGVVVERLEKVKDARRKRLHQAIEQSLRDSAVPVYKVGDDEMLSAFAYPSLSNRKELRQVVATIWPILLTKKGPATKLDAAALGLYFQTERLFQN